MPMEESYWELMKSPIADMKNTGARYGGAITAALFLKQYIDAKKVRLWSWQPTTCVKFLLDSAAAPVLIRAMCGKCMSKGF